MARRIVTPTGTSKPVAKPVEIVEAPREAEEGVEVLTTEKAEESFDQLVHKLRGFLNAHPDVKNWSARKHQLFNLLLNSFNE